MPADRGLPFPRHSLRIDATPGERGQGGLISLLELKAKQIRLRFREAMASPRGRDTRTEKARKVLVF